MSQNDIEIKNELHLRKVLNSGKYKTVVGDPMIKALIKKENAEKIKFISFPHVAVSSKVHWDEYVDFLGENSIRWLENIR